MTNKFLLSETMPDIEFEGETVKAKRGVYRCPFNCGDKRFGQPTWKTEAGFRKHMASCYQRPSAVTKRAEKAAAEEQAAQVDFDRRKAAALAALTHKIGDEIFFVREVVTKPTHMMRGGRKRHVRYEEEKRFDACRAIIKTISFDGGGIFFNGYIAAYTLKPSMEEAARAAADAQKGWDEHCAFSSSCR